MNKDKKIKVLFVCMGNICRSPTAHGVFEKMVKDAGLTDKIEVDSAGTHSYHIGSQPDQRSQQTALAHGVDLSYIRARQVTSTDFDYFDYVLAMDDDNYNNLSQLSNKDNFHKLHLFLNFAPRLKPNSKVPDPYYGGERGFDNVYDLVVQASEGLLLEIQSN
jgi:low molecular weight protein-tyrosine phosphatase